MDAREATDYSRLAELLQRNGHDDAATAIRELLATKTEQAKTIEALEATVVALHSAAPRSNDGGGGIRVIGRAGVADVFITASDGTTSHVLVDREDVLATAASFAAIAFDRMLDEGLTGEAIFERFTDAVERESKAGVARGREMQA